MNERWRQTFLCRAEEPSFKALVRTANEYVTACVQSARKCYVTFSGGKDSLVVVHLVRQLFPTMMVYHWDYGPYFVPRPVHDELQSIARHMGIELFVETSDEYERFGRRAKNVWYRKHFGHVVPRLRREGYDLVFLGLRAEESGKRKRRIAEGRSLAMREGWPIAHWKWLDVWAYIVSNSLPYLRWYDLQAEAGIVGYDKSRFSTMFDHEFKAFGGPENVLLWRHRNV